MIWLGFSTTLRRWSLERDRNPRGRDWQRRFENLSGIGIVVYSLTMTFAIIDWIMSLDATWLSTIYGLIYLAGQGLTAFSISIIAVLLLSQEEPMRTMLRKTELHDIGKLLFAFVMLYAYLSFSQWLIIWSGNMLSEIRWYLMRLQNGWQYFGTILIFVHFVFPFALLLSRNTKRSIRRVVAIAFLLMFMRLVDLFWQTAPNFYPGGKDGGLEIVVEAKPDVFNHNLETVPSLYLTVRPGARYFHSLRLLQRVKELDPAMFTKSGIMVGLGEERNEVLQVMDDLRSADVDFLTIGQYLQPTRKHHEVKRFVPPDEFRALETIAYSKGFLMVAASPLTRSSHHAGEDFARLKTARAAKI